MTLGRPGRGPAGRDDGQRFRAPESFSAGVEVEELPPQRVVAQGRSRFGLGGAFVLGAAAVLLAAGFGFWGGRPTATSPAVAARTTGVPTPAPAFTGEPLVTPARPCGGSPSGPPGVLLEVGGRSTMGAFEVLDRRPGASPSAGGLAGMPFYQPPPTVDIRSDIVPEVWTAGRACVVGWRIEVVGVGMVDVLDFLDNPERIPGLASQNRFRLILAPYRGQTLDLRATLVFPDFTVRATWPIQVLPFTPPAGIFISKQGQIPTFPGCDIELTLGNGSVTRPYPCGHDVVDTGGTPKDVKPGQQLVFEFDHEGWQLDDAAVACGRLVSTTFVVETTCRLEDPVRDTLSMTLAVPRLSGAFALAVTACGTQELADATNRLCGTWYANLEVSG